MEELIELSEYEVQRRQKAIELVGLITNFVNTTSMNQDFFNHKMSMEHRTLQQSFTRLCLNWLEHCAKPEYRTDPRNEDSKRVAQLISTLLEKETGYPLSGAHVGHV
jgi:hypothetical protein